MPQPAEVEKRLHEAEHRWRRAVERLRAAKAQSSLVHGDARRQTAEVALDRATREAHDAERQLVRAAEEMQQQRLAALRARRARA